MIPDGVRECTLFLSSCYNVRVPGVFLTEDIPPRYAAAYDWDNETILLRPSALTERNLVHEFAHHLQKVYGLPNERGAEAFEEIAECGVCKRVFPTPETHLGAIAGCPWCGSKHKRVEGKESPQTRVGLSTVLGFVAVGFSVAGVVAGLYGK